MPSDSKKKRDAKRKDGAKAIASNGTTSGNLKNGSSNGLTVEGTVFPIKEANLIKKIGIRQLLHFNTDSYC